MPISIFLTQDQQQHIDTISPTQDIFEKTSGFMLALQVNGHWADAHYIWHIIFMAECPAHEKDEPGPSGK